MRAASTFAQGWLVPRPSRFFKLHPEINLHLRTAVGEVDFDRDDVQIAIHYGHVRQSGVVVEPFLRDVIEPACSPETASRFGSPAELRKLREFPLAWLQHAEIDISINKQVRMFESSILAYQAAAEPRASASRWLRCRSLASSWRPDCSLLPLNRPLVRPHTHQLVYRTAAVQAPAVHAFREWMLYEAGASSYGAT